MAGLILRSQYNKLITAIYEADLDPKLFYIKNEISTDGYKYKLPIRIEVENTDYFMNIKYSYWSDVIFKVSYYPGESSTVVSSATESCKTWYSVIGVYEKWINRINVELNEPNLYLIFNQNDFFMDETSEYSNPETSFNDDEIDQIDTLIYSIKKYIVDETSPELDQIEMIDRKLDYLLNAANRQSKKDWIHTAIGALFSLAIGLSLAPNQANRLFAFIAEFAQRVLIKLLP